MGHSAVAGFVILRADTTQMRRDGIAVKKRRVMVITAGRHQAPLILKARALGFEVLATDRDAGAASFAHADHRAVVDSADRESLLRIAREFSPHAILSEQTDIAIPAVAYVAEELGLPGIGVEAAKRATDKFAMREACEQTGIPTPKFRLATTLEEAVTAAREIGFPLVVKPVDNQASRGVTKIKDETRFVRCGRSCIFSLAHASNFARRADDRT